MLSIYKIIKQYMSKLDNKKYQKFKLTLMNRILKNLIHK